MKQVFQDVAGGATTVVDVPVPKLRQGDVLIRTTRSLISSGTERSLVEFGRASYLEKARQQPDKVKQVLDKARTDGVLATVDAVRSKLSEPMPMGYSNVGVVVDVGAGVDGFAVGDRVVSNGRHAEVVSVPRNLCAAIPDGVSDEAAAFTVLGAIALQGVRLTRPTLGESIVVVGLGLIGLLTVQLLRANGCRVIGIDLDSGKLDLAEELGARTVRVDRGADPVETVLRLTKGVGADGVILTASASGDELIHQAATMSRKRGRIVLVGVVGLNLRRSDFYEKELTFQVSCSYGPGRYDPSYEELGHDYPLPFVRWTENRNFQAFLGLLAEERVTVSRLITATFPVDRAAEAYERVLTDRTALGVVLEYPESESGEADFEGNATVILRSRVGGAAVGAAPTVGALGAGNYAGRVLLPSFKRAGARLKVVVSSQGRSGDHVGRSLGFEVNTTDERLVFDDDEIDVVVIGTRHDSHAHLTRTALDRGKHVFVEKPLALAHDEIDAIEESLSRARGQLMVGFNRRFAPLVVQLAESVQREEPMSLLYTCNAGNVPPESWVHDPDVGGGRLVGEACHFIDLARFLVGHPITGAEVAPMKGNAGRDLRDTFAVTLRFENGSLAVITYFANGHRSFPKERVELFQSGKVYRVDNFRRLSAFGDRSARRRLWRQDKGQDACVAAFIEAVRSGGPAPIASEELIEVARISVDLAAAVRAMP